jgi:hypothetical protein
MVTEQGLPDPEQSPVQWEKVAPGIACAANVTTVSFGNVATA